MHWPQTSKDYELKDSSFLPYGSSPSLHDAWRQMSEIYKEGSKVKAVGVSNFSKKTLEELFAEGGKDG